MSPSVSRRVINVLPLRGNYHKKIGKYKYFLRIDIKKARISFDTSMKNEFYNPLTKTYTFRYMQVVCQIFNFFVI